MVNIRTLALLYKGHIRARPLPELLALLGIAAGVALLFAVQVANKSITGSFDQLAKGVAGKASLEVAARSPQGFDQNVYRKVKRLPDVERAAPVLERRIAVRGPKGRKALTLVGFDDRLARLGGSLVKRIARRRDLADLGFHLTDPTAKTIGVVPGKTVTVEIGERSKRLPLAGVASSDEIGTLSRSPIALLHLGLAQDIAAMPERITRILVSPVPGREAQAKEALKKVTAGTLDVRPSNAEAKLLTHAATADRQSSALFSVISLVVGVLLAYNAMLLTITARRRTVASLHMLGASNKTIVSSLIFDALILGLIGSLVGIVIGDQLSRYVMHQVPGYLSSSFPIGSQRVIGLQVILLSIAGGTLAALTAAAQPAISLLKAGPLAAFSEKGADAAEMRSSATQKKLLISGIFLVALFMTLSLLFAKTTLVGIAAFILGMVLIIPSIVTYILAPALNLVRRTGSAALRISLGELSATPVRATALATVGALAIFAILAIAGTARDLQRGIGQGTENFFSNADVWISPQLEENTFVSQPFNQKAAAQRLRRLSAVKSVRTYQGSFYDLGDRRLRIIGESRHAPYPIAPSQFVDGNFELATSRIRRGGWVALTETVANERNLKIGKKFDLPTPTGNRQFKLAATTTNYGWDSGTLLINTRDYTRAWGTSQASALEVDLADGVPVAEGKSAIRHALGKTSALSVQTAEEGRDAYAATTRQGLSRLNQIADMVLVAAILAVATAMLGSAWQRRQRLWGLVSLGMGSGQLYRTIFFETGMILLLGCFIGVAFGFIGQAFVGRWLHVTTAYPVPFEPALMLALKILILAVLLSVVAVAIPLRVLFSKRRVAGLTPE